MEQDIPRCSRDAKITGNDNNNNGRNPAVGKCVSLYQENRTAIARYSTGWLRQMSPPDFTTLHWLPLVLRQHACLCGCQCGIKSARFRGIDLVKHRCDAVVPMSRQI